MIGPSSGTTASNASTLAATTLSADAQTLILADVAAGNEVMTPNQMVTVNGVTTVGWWVTNPTTGHTISHFVNGGHQALIEDVFINLRSVSSTSNVVAFIGLEEGCGLAGLQFAADVLQGVAARNLKVTKKLLASPPPLGTSQTHTQPK